MRKGKGSSQTDRAEKPVTHHTRSVTRMSKLGGWLQTHFWSALSATGVLSAVVGALVSDFAGYRATNREILKKELEISQQADHELFAILRKFSDKATDRGTINDDDIKNLRVQVSKSFVAAEHLATRFPIVKADFEEYSTSLIALQKSAEKFSGPIDAKAFVESVNGYFVSKHNFDERVATLQSWWP